MADTFDAKAVISAQIEGIKAVMDDLAMLEHGIGSITDVSNKLKDVNTKLGGLKDVGKSAKDASTGVDSAAKSVAGLAGQAKEAETSLPRLRYALYDVATTATATSLAITAAGTGVAVLAAQYESAFTNVERTLDNVGSAGVAQLREDLVGLTQEIPKTFSDVAQIATLGNQLGIASGDVAAFTETVSKFSAVTGLTAEASAQAFGGLGELLNVSATEYENLGSSIALVGRRSVATEQEIVAMTTRLAASATTAGFSAQQVVALSGAFASLRIAPERAQGVMEVYFKQLNTAISEGGDRLDAFARVAGITSGEVEGLVRTNPVEFFQKLAVGLGEMDNIAQTGALAELGLQGIRAGEVFGRVSANVGVFNQALSDSGQGWTEGTELADQYAKVLDDLASKWQIFLNAASQAGAAVGGVLAPALKVALDALSFLLQGFSALVSTPVGAFFAGVALIIAGIVAALTGFVGVSALTLASMAAMKTAIAELGITSGASAIGLRGLGAAASQVGVAMGFGAGAIRTFKIALASTGIGLIVVALGSLAAGLYDVATASGATSEEVQGLSDSLSQAISADTQASLAGTGAAVAELSAGFTSSISVTDRAAAISRDYAGVQQDTAGSVDAATQKIQDQTRILGENAEAFFRNQLAQDADFKELANDAELRTAAENAGFTVGELITQGMKSQGGFTAYVDGLRAEAARIRDEVNASGATYEDPLTQKAMNQSTALLQAAEALGPYVSKMDETRAASEAAATAAEYAGSSAEGAAAGYGTMGDAAATAAEGMWATEQAAMGVESKIYALGAAVGENSGMWDSYSDAGRKNLGALYEVLDAIAAETPGNTGAIAANFQALYNQLISGGYASAEQLSFLQQKVVDLANTGVAAFSSLRAQGASIGGAVGNIMQVAGRLGESAAKNVKPAQRNFTSLFNGIQSGADKAAKAVGGGGGGGNGGLTREVRTLVDYAGDLSSVMKRAFEIRFGGQQGMDAITSGWQKITEAADKAREAAEEHARTLAGMGADRSIKQYWLSVAENYGDELRAAKLRAELAELDADMAKEKKDLTAAQDAASMSLVGNSAAAIQNRANLLGLVGNYQDYLKALAASGASQATLEAESQRLRGEFVRQATQMGFNRSEVDLYSVAFDDMTTIINNVPRNITVTANVNPALQALAELEAKARSASNAVNSIGSGGGGAANVLAYKTQYLLASANAAIAVAQAVAASLSGNIFAALGYRGSAIGWQIAANAYRNAGGFKSGGYTGDGGTSQVAGVVHGKEFVMSAPAVKNAGGPNAMAYMHNMLKAGKGFGPVGIGASGGGASGPVDLSANSLRQLSGMLAANLQLVLPGAQLAGSVGANNIVSNRMGRA